MAISAALHSSAAAAAPEGDLPIVPMSDSYRDMVFPGGQNNTGFIPLWLGLGPAAP